MLRRQLLRLSLASLSLSVMLPLAPVAAEEVSAFKDTSRIVAIGGSITEIVYALGQESMLVARDSTSVYPSEAFKLPDVGYMRQLSPEGVLSVNPSGILALQGSGPKEAVDVLKKASVAYIEIPDRFDHEGIVGKVRAVGKAIGKEAEAEVLAKDVDAKLTAAEAGTKDIAERKRVLFVLSMQGGKILASGTDTAADGIIKLAGAVNAVEGYSGYKQLTDEAAITAKPDVVLMMKRGGSPSVTAEELFALPAMASTPAGQNKNLVVMDGAYLLGFGPRTAEAVHELAVSLYGDKVTD